MQETRSLGAAVDAAAESDDLTPGEPAPGAATPSGAGPGGDRLILVRTPAPVLASATRGAPFVA